MNGDRRQCPYFTLRALVLEWRKLCPDGPNWGHDQGGPPRGGRTARCGQAPSLQIFPALPGRANTICAFLGPKKALRPGVRSGHQSSRRNARARRVRPRRLLAPSNTRTFRVPPTPFSRGRAMPFFSKRIPAQEAGVFRGANILNQVMARVPWNRTGPTPQKRPAFFGLCWVEGGTARKKNQRRS